MSSTAALLPELKANIDRPVAAARAEGHAAAMAEIRSIVGGELASVKRGPGRPRKDATAVVPARSARRRARKNPWARLSPAGKLARVNAIRKGRGLPLKAEL